jgi:hypothetical protein
MLGDVIDLHPCPGCRRHVAVTDARCPFCGAAQVATAPHVVTAGRLSRAAVFATLAAGAVACGGKPVREDRKVEPIVDAAVAEPASVDAPARPDDQVIQPDPDDWRNNRPSCENGVCPPYGGPPARRRVV